MPMSLDGDEICLFPGGMWAAERVPRSVPPKRDYTLRYENLAA